MQFSENIRVCQMVCFKMLPMHYVNIVMSLDSTTSNQKKFRRLSHIIVRLLMHSVNGAATIQEALETRQVQIREDSCFKGEIDECIRVNRIIGVGEITPEAMINHKNKWFENDL
jgi:hypothetical protein